MQVVMSEVANPSRVWAWSNKSYSSVTEFVMEFNTQAHKFGFDSLHKEQAAQLDLCKETQTTKWIFKVV